MGRRALVEAGAPEEVLCCLTLDDPRAVALGIGAGARRRTSSSGA